MVSILLDTGFRYQILYVIITLNIMFQLFNVCFQKIPGVIAFYAAKEIPGKNSFTPLYGSLLVADEEILCSKEVKFYGQPAGIIVADREKTANNAASVVNINYESISKNKPMITIDNVLKSPEKDKRLVNNKTVEPTEIGNDVKCVLYGELKLETQYHYTMEPQTCVVRPSEEGLEVYSSTQWLDVTNVAVAQCLNRNINRFDVHDEIIFNLVRLKSNKTCSKCLHLFF